MKALKYLLAFTITLNMACAQHPNKSLDGKSFQISSWDVNQPNKQDPDVIVFRNGKMDSEACHQYGFTEAPYTSTYANGEVSFSGTILSPNEGSIMIEGKVRENTISGKMLWKKAGQNDIIYDYKGSLKTQ